MTEVVTLQNVVNALVVLLVALVAAGGVGGLAAGIAFMRQNKRSMEMAYNALPPVWQAFIRQIVEGVGGVYEYVEDVTDSEFDEPEGRGGAG